MSYVIDMSVGECVEGQLHQRPDAVARGHACMTFAAPSGRSICRANRTWAVLLKRTTAVGLGKCDLASLSCTTAVRSSSVASTQGRGSGDYGDVDCPHGIPLTLQTHFDTTAIDDDTCAPAVC